MKKLITICVGLIVAGCATTTQLEETKGQLAAADTKIQDLEKRLARIEGDLYRVEVKSAPKAEKPEPPKPAEPKFIPAKEVEKNVVDAKVDAFLKEYFGVQFGDSIDKFPGKASGALYNCRYKGIPALKKFEYFDKAIGRFVHDKLYRVMFYTEIDTKYSVDSTNEKMEQAFADLAVTLGLDSNAIGFVTERRTKKISSYHYFKLINPGETWGFGSNKGVRRYAVCIEDEGLKNRLEEEKRQEEAAARRKANAEGETLPDPE